MLDGHTQDEIDTLLMGKYDSGSKKSASRGFSSRRNSLDRGGRS
jgi:hypothetical protein